VNGMGDADIVAIHREGGHSCIQVFFVRNDRNYGNRATYPQHDGEMSDGELMESFLAQFYSDKEVPRTIYLSHPPEDTAMLETALAQKSGHAVDLVVPKLGEKKRVVDMALANAKESLARRVAERQSQQKLLEGVAQAFGLVGPPERVEVYDNSHISGSHALGAMIVAGPEGFIKKAYRKFNIKDTALSPGDDFGMMREVLKRRFARALEENPDRAGPDWPGLVLVDGGLGQLNAAVEVMADLGLSDIPLVGIAKGPDRNAGRERFFIKGRPEFQLEPRDPVLYYLQRLRDEAHRFAIGGHRARRVRAISGSPLDGVPGIGPSRKKKLLMHFGSGQGVARAGLEDLKRVPGISADLARKIYEYFHSS
jgi:excinuclease ABC subunit C